MGLALRIYLFDADDRLYRLPNSKFDQMLRDSASHHFRQFAKTRTRMASGSVELVDRRPMRIVWSTFNWLSFDKHGYLDANALDRHQRALAEVALSSELGRAQNATEVVDATDRFIAQGGRWKPSTAVARLIDDAAFGRVKCRRL
jgi:hypothetical protein